ncbi:MAG TPA: DeoR family transcriptional regulator [Chthoniobacterales bacterium]|nr:DeoR family transcriptional regulator [Chthoniobacterales bacterium]
MDHRVDLFVEERQPLLLELLRTQGKVRVQDVSAIFGVSPDTIRRDLNRLVRAGLAKSVPIHSTLTAFTPRITT